MNRRCRSALFVVFAGASSALLGLAPLFACIDTSGLEGERTTTRPDGDIAETEGGRADVSAPVDPIDGGKDGEVPPVSGKGVRCGATTCQGDASACCLEGTPRCIVAGVGTCSGTVLDCDDRDDCPVETGGPVLPHIPIVCCLMTAEVRSGCVRSDRCIDQGEQALCDPTLGDQCAAGGFGPGTGTSSITPYKRCQ